MCRTRNGGFVSRARLRAAALALAVFLPGAADAQPVLPAVWHYRDTFDGGGSIDEILPEATSPAGGAAEPHPAIPLGSIATLWWIAPADRPQPLVEFAGRSYRLREEGLYRFLQRPDDRRAPAESGLRNLIFLRSADSTVPFLRGLSRLIAHGNRDDVQPTRVLLPRLADRPWAVLTCGPARDLAIAALQELSPAYRTRRVDAFAAAGTENGFDDSHSLFEVSGGAFRAWTAVDIDYGLMFRASGEDFLDTAALVAALAGGGAVRYEELSPKEFDLEFVGRERAAGYNFAVYQQRGVRDARARDRWYRRVLQRPVIAP